LRRACLVCTAALAGRVGGRANRPAGQPCTHCDISYLYPYSCIMTFGGVCMVKVGVWWRAATPSARISAHSLLRDDNRNLSQNAYAPAWTDSVAVRTGRALGASLSLPLCSALISTRANAEPSSNALFRGAARISLFLRALPLAAAAYSYITARRAALASFLRQQRRALRTIFNIALSRHQHSNAQTRERNNGISALAFRAGRSVL